MILLKFFAVLATGLMVGLMVHELVIVEASPVWSGYYAGAAVVNLLVLFVLLKEDP